MSPHGVRVAWAWCVLAVLRGAPTLPAAEADGFTVPTIDDTKILTVMPARGYRLPEKIFTPEYLKGIAEKTYPNILRGRKDRTRKWLTVPEDRWQELISDFAPVGTRGGNMWAGGKCPFTGKDYYRGARMTDEAFLTTPFQARTVEGDHVIYAREQDMPADYRWRPNRTVEVPHLDGTVHAYRFYAPAGTENAPPKFNSARRHWLCPAGEVWRCRLQIIMQKVVPDLMAAVFHNKDAKSARALAVILDRIAEVYPELPLCSQFMAHGFARTRDGKNYLTRADYRAIAKETPFHSWEHKPYWFHSIYDYNYAKLNYGLAGWTDAVMDQLGMLATAVEVVEDHPAVKAYSREKHGQPGAWRERIQKRLIDEAVFLAMANPPTRGNTSYGYIKGAVTLGIVARNEYLFKRGLEIVELYLYNNWDADGMPNDGAFNYAAMTYGIINFRWMNKLWGGLDLKQRFPILATIERLTCRPVRTLFNIASKHADQHARFFINRRPWMGQPEPGKLPYEQHEQSQCFPVYGLTCLRGGKPGSRLEMILDHQDTANHVHYSRLNIQLFYEGVDLLPDFGYSVGTIDPTKEPWRSYTYPFELMGPPDTRDKWGPWRHGYAMLPEAHCVGMVDHWLYEPTPSRLHAYLGGMTLGDPGYWAQLVDASARGVFRDRPNPVDVFRRQLVVLTLPGGRSAVVDVFRIHGGARHDLFWHIPSDPKQTTLAKPTPIRAPHLQKYFGLRPHYEKLTGKAKQHYGRAPRLIAKLQRHPMPDGVYRADYHVQPHQFLPPTKRSLKRYGVWPKLLHDVHLRLWGARFGSPVKREELIGARGPWPGILDEIDPRTGKLTKNAMVGFKDALHFLILSRVGKKPGLASTFVHVLEPRNPQQQPALTDVQVVDAQPARRGGGVTCRLKLARGGEAIVATTLNGETYETKHVQLRGRLGAVCPGSGDLALVDGTRFAAGGWGVTLEPTRALKLVGVIGDLTGHPKQSALVVQCARPLPTDRTLVGRMLFVDHRAGNEYRTGYTIARVSPYGTGRWRIDLADTPPFIQHRMRVWKIDDKDPCVLYQDFRLYKGQGKVNYEGRRVRFPRTGQEGVMASGTWDRLTLKQAPPRGAVKPGDPFIVYTIQPGDRVVIPSHFACRGMKRDRGLCLRIVATGPVTLRVPGGFAGAFIGPEGTRPSARVTREEGGVVVVQLAASDLTDGRALLHLAK